MSNAIETAPTAAALTTWAVPDLLFRAAWCSMMSWTRGGQPENVWCRELQRRFGVIEGAEMMLTERRAIEAERAAI